MDKPQPILKIPNDLYINDLHFTGSSHCLISDLVLFYIFVSLHDVFSCTFYNKQNKF